MGEDECESNIVCKWVMCLSTKINKRVSTTLFAFSDFAQDWSHFCHAFLKIWWNLLSETTKPPYLWVIYSKDKWSCSSLLATARLTRMHSSRMRTARSLPYRGGLHDRDPLDRDPSPRERPPGQKPPRQRPPGQRYPRQRPPGLRLPGMETPWTGTDLPGWRPPGTETETPPREQNQRHV